MSAWQELGAICGVSGCVARAAVVFPIAPLRATTVVTRPAVAASLRQRRRSPTWHWSSRQRQGAPCGAFRRPQPSQAAAQRQVCLRHEMTVERSSLLARQSSPKVDAEAESSPQCRRTLPQRPVAQSLHHRSHEAQHIAGACYQKVQQQGRWTFARAALALVAPMLP